MDPQRILKALSNPHRLDIILWLKPQSKNSVFKYTLKLSSIFQSALALKVFKKAEVYRNRLYLHL